MSEIVRLIISQKLLRPFIGLFILSTITIVLMIVTSHMISSLLVDVSPGGFLGGKAYATLFVVVYVASVLSNLLTEYHAQTTTAKVAGLVGRSYIDNIKNTNQAKNAYQESRLDYSSLLTTQLEGFRAEYILPFTNILSRGLIIVVTFLYLIFVYKLYALIGIGIGVLIGLIYYLCIAAILKVVDAGLTHVLDYLGNIVGRLTNSYIFLYYSDISTPLAKQFSEKYIVYGRYRGLNAIVSLAPRFLIETCLVVAIFFREEFGSSEALAGDTVFLAFLFFRLNPHVQIFIKNIGTMRMAKTSFNEGISTGKDRIVKEHKDLPSVSLPDIEWNPLTHSLLQVRGPSGSGKTTMGYAVADYYRSLGYSVAFIESNPHLPYTSVREVYSFNPNIKSLIDGLDLNIDEELDVMLLSNGERQRLLIGLALTTDQDLIVLDEGLSALDSESLTSVFKVLQSSEIPLLFISHQINAIDFMDDTTAQDISLTILKSKGN